MLESMLDVEDLSPDRVRGLTRVEYNALGELGLLQDERVELLRGQIVVMSPIGRPHIRLTIWLNRYLIEHLDRAFEVHPSLPFAASDDSEPEPDMMIVRADPSAEDHPHEALLIMEFSDSSLRKDRKIKLPIYAEAGVPEYWIFDLSRHGQLTVEVYRDPTPTGYTTMTVHRDGDILRPLHVPIEIAVAEIPR
jgi:Uma2 family endonuclease